MKMKFAKTMMISAVALTLCACSNDEYDFDNLFPESYHKIVYMQGDREAAAVVYDTGEETSLQFSVMKGGSDPTTTAEADVVAVPQEELDQMNMGYVQIPADCYTFDGHVSFASEQQYNSVKVVFNVANLETFMATLTSEQTPVMALKIASSDATINSEKDRLIRTLTVQRPKVGFSSETVNLGMAVGSIDLTAVLDADNLWDFTCDLNDSDIAARVAAYNQANKTNYVALPVENYELASKQFSFVKGNKEAKINLKLKDGATPLDLSKTYLLPLTIENCTKESFELNPAECFVVVSAKVSISIDMLSSPCTQSGDGAGLPGLIDDNWNTYWHSVWQTNYLDAVYGHSFDVALKAPLSQQLKFQYGTRDYNPVLPLEVKLWVSENGKSWTELCHLTAAADKLPGVSSTYMSQTYQLSSKVNYVRFSVLKSNNGRCGVDNGACVAITGFNLWGK